MNPTYEYALFFYFPPTAGSLILTYALILAPAVVYRPSNAIASYGASLIFVMTYVPAQLILLFNWQRSLEDLALVQSSLALSMVVIFWTSRFGLRPTSTGADSLREPGEISDVVSVAIGILTFICSITFIYNYRDSMRFVGYEDIYDLRFVASQAERGPFAAYSLALLNSCFLPYYWAVGIYRKSWLHLGVGTSLSLLIYAALAFKTALLIGPIIFSLYLAFADGRTFFRRLIIGAAVAVIVMMAIPSDDGGPIDFANALVQVRTLGIGGWTIGVYYDFFSSNPLTYYSHIGPVNAVTDAYAYGNYSLGQVIGLAYVGSEEANFNANFWASDAFAALGLAGVPVVSAMIAAVFFMINRASNGTSTRFVLMWSSGFWLALLNSPVTTSLLSGGGLLMMLLLIVNRRSRRLDDEEIPHSQATSLGAATAGE